MRVPLRKVVKRDLIHKGASLSKRGDTITMTNYYNTLFTLECGHRIEMCGSCAPNVASKRCKACSSAAEAHTRGGGDDGSGPLRSVAELIAATENPPPVPPEIWRRGGK